MSKDANENPKKDTYLRRLLAAWNVLTKRTQRLVLLSAMAIALLAVVGLYILYFSKTDKPTDPRQNYSNSIKEITQRDDISDTDRVNYLREYAVEREIAGDYESARDAILEIEQLGYANAQDFQSIGYIYQKLGDETKASEYFNQSGIDMDKFNSTEGLECDDTQCYQ